MYAQKVIIKSVLFKLNDSIEFNENDKNFEKVTKVKTINEALIPPFTESKKSAKVIFKLLSDIS
jgi:hypothetical protein